MPFASFERLAAAAPPQVETWVRDGDLQLIVQDSMFLRPWEDAAYAARVLGFPRAPLRSVGRSGLGPRCRRALDQPVCQSLELLAQR